MFLIENRIFTSKVVFNPTAQATIESPNKNILKRKPSS
jgi:hypothetical protein